MPFGDTIDLSNFEAYIQLFAAANIAWAGSKTFREAFDELSNRIFIAERDFLEKIKKGRDDVKNKRFKNTILQRIEAKTAEYSEKFQTLKTEIAKDEGFTLVHKNNFVMTSGVCLILLILSGLQNRIDRNFYCTLLAGLNTILVFNIYTLIKSWPRNFAKQLNPKIPFIFFGLIFLICSVLSRYKITECLHGIVNYIITFITLFTIASPFIFHFIRAYKHNFYFYRKIVTLGYAIDYDMDVIKETDETLDHISSEDSFE